jgi:Protein of unknown function (DUF3558)
VKDKEGYVKRLVVLAGLAVTLMSVAACGSTPGQPTAVTTTAGGGAGQTSAAGTSDEPSSAGSGSGSLPVDQPCSLLSSSDLQQLNVSSPPSADKVGTANSCELDTAADHIGLDIRTDAGLADFDAVPNGGPVSDLTIGSHQAKQEADPSSSSCDVAIGVTSSSRVDVSTTGDGNTDPCPVAVAAAKLVEPKLP